MTNYQTRMTKFVRSINVYSVLCPAAILYFDLSGLAWVIFASTLTVGHLLAVGFDAVYDSLLEHQPTQQAAEELHELTRSTYANH